MKIQEGLELDEKVIGCWKDLECWLGSELQLKQSYRLNDNMEEEPVLLVITEKPLACKVFRGYPEESLMFVSGAYFMMCQYKDLLRHFALEQEERFTDFQNKLRLWTGG